MSPTISALPRSAPKRRDLAVDDGGGIISAIGSPKRVTRIGFPVFRTCSSRARQVALNFEIAISSIEQKIVP